LDGFLQYSAAHRIQDNKILRWNVSKGSMNLGQVYLKMIFQAN